MRKPLYFRLAATIAFAWLALASCKTDSVGGVPGGGEGGADTGGPDLSGDCVMNPSLVGEWAQTDYEGYVETYVFNSDGTGEEIDEEPGEDPWSDPISWCVIGDYLRMEWSWDEEKEIWDASFYLDGSTLYLDVFTRTAGFGESGTWTAFNNEREEWDEGGELKVGSWSETDTLVIDGNTATYTEHEHYEEDGVTDESHSVITGDVSRQGSGFVVTITDCESNDPEYCDYVDIGSQAAGCLIADGDVISFSIWNGILDCASEGYVKQ
jgi:hypothetical protein